MEANKFSEKDLSSSTPERQHNKIKFMDFPGSKKMLISQTEIIDYQDDKHNIKMIIKLIYADN